MVKRVLLGGVIALILGGALLFLLLPGTCDEKLESLGTIALKPVEPWCDDQLRAIAAEYLNVEFDFDELDFETPDTVRLDRPRLVEGDLTIFECNALHITFAEVPMYGEPVVIQDLRFDTPSLRFISRDDGALIGWDHLIRESEGERLASGGSTRLRDVFDIRNIIVREGLIVVDPREGDPPMELRGLEMDLDAKPAEPGWFALETTLRREPILDVDFTGRISFDENQLDLSEVAANVQLSADDYDIFPPAVQSFLEEHEIDGALTLIVAGEIPFSEIETSRLRAEATLSDTHYAAGDLILPIETAALSFDVENEVLTIRSLEMQTLSGSLSTTGEIRLRSGKLMNLKVRGEDLHIDRLARQPDDDTPAGVIDFAADVGAINGRVAETLGVLGEMRIEEAKLVSLPVISTLVDEAGGDRETTGSDRGTADIAITPDRPRELQMTDVEIISGAIAARGSGSISFDQEVDFLVNAGVLERVQGLLGEIGDLLARITNPLVKYRVTGTLEETQVEVLPLGVGAEK